MAEVSWHDLMSDTTRFPDGLLWTLDDGSQIALGTLRQTMRGSYVPKTDYDTLRSQSEEQRTALLREKQTLEAQLIERLSQPAPATTSVPDVYQTDPLFKPMYDKVAAVETENAGLKKMLTDMQTLQQQMFGTIQQIPVVMKVQQIQAKDSSVDAQKLLDFARQHQIQPQFLEDAHILMTHEQAVAQARAAGEAAGAERVKAELAAQPPPVPYAPFGPFQVAPQGQPHFETDQALEQAMLGDPEMYNVYMGQQA